MDTKLDDALRVVTRALNYIGSAALTAMMLLTVTDVILRAFGHPIIGTFEIVGILLTVVIGLTIPKVSFDKGHVFMEVVVERLTTKQRVILTTITRILCTLLFVLIGYNLFSVANEFRAANEVSPTLEIPFYPAAYAVGICCFIQCLVFINDIVRMFRGQYE